LVSAIGKSLTVFRKLGLGCSEAYAGLKTESARGLGSAATAGTKKAGHRRRRHLAANYSLYRHSR